IAIRIQQGSACGYLFHKVVQAAPTVVLNEEQSRFFRSIRKFCQRPEWGMLLDGWGMARGRPRSAETAFQQFRRAKERSAGQHPAKSASPADAGSAGCHDAGADRSGIEAGRGVLEQEFNPSSALALPGSIRSASRYS